MDPHAFVRTRISQVVVSFSLTILSCQAYIVKNLIFIKFDEYEGSDGEL